MSHADTHRSAHSTPSKGLGGMQKGPIHTPMAAEMIPGDPEDFNATGGGIYDGLDAPYTKGTPTEAKELTFDNSGAFGKVPKVNK
jgi:hypothetical protein